MVVEFDRRGGVVETGHLEELVVVVGVARARQAVRTELGRALLALLQLLHLIPMVLPHPQQRNRKPISLVLLFDQLVHTYHCVDVLEAVYNAGIFFLEGCDCGGELLFQTLHESGFQLQI